TLFARSGLQKADFREYCSTAEAEFPGAKKNGKRESFGIQNTNRLLTGADGVAPYKGIAGVKNGYTTHAGNTFTGVAERDGRVLLVTVMNPSSEVPHAVYKEAASLLDWGFDASGKVTPVGELVPPKSADTQDESGTGSGKGPTSDTGEGEGMNGSSHAAGTAAAGRGGGGMGIALGIAGGVVVLLAGGAFLINRRWPLPDLVRRLPRR
ncbi:D-alanyl-D-alanine carboxypeptidase, partial [Streptomyces sp. NPDC088178]